MADTIKNVYTYTTANSSGAALDITNIPQDGRHLIFVLASENGGDSPDIKYNGLSSNYAYSYRDAMNGTTASSTNASSMSGISSFVFSDTYYNGTFFVIPFYSGTGFYKTVISHNGQRVYYFSNWYRYPYAGTYSNLGNNSGITSLNFTNLPANCSISVNVVY